VAEAVTKENLIVAAVLSGNRNFEGRINPQVKANYLASPPLVVAYAIAGTMNIDLSTEPLGEDGAGAPVYLRDIWPTNEEVQSTVRGSINQGMFAHQYAQAFDGDENWKTMPVPTGQTFAWDPKSTYIKKPPYFDNMVDPATSVTDFAGMKALAMLGDSVTTDHISPAGSIPKDSPAGRYLISQGVAPADFNSYGARRGNHEVMVRGTLANIRLKNQLAPGTEGGWTKHQPSGEQMSIYDASMRFQAEGVPLLILAGKEYGSGSSRDWAAKGVMLLGVKAAIAESFERIHRTNLVGMGVLPLQYQAGQTASSLGLTGTETFAVDGVKVAMETGARTAVVRAVDAKGVEKVFTVDVRVDTPQEWEYYRNGGILPYVLRQLAG
jgi:aconitate hydratase